MRLYNHRKTLRISRRLITRPHNRPLTTSNISSPGSAAYSKDSYKRRPDHIPNTGRDEQEIYVLALHTDSKHQDTLDALRKQHYPAKLNKIPAHVCLFHALPGSKLPNIQEDIQNVVNELEPFLIKTKQPLQFANGHGVALSVDAPLAQRIHVALKSEWRSFLSKQDQSFRAHYTIANQLDEKACQSTLKHVQENFGGSEGQVDGLTLVRYEKGFWKDPQEFMFSKT